MTTEASANEPAMPVPSSLGEINATLAEFRKTLHARFETTHAQMTQFDDSLDKLESQVGRLNDDNLSLKMQVRLLQDDNVSLKLYVRLFVALMTMVAITGSVVFSIVLHIILR
jgi:chromosome segregation ATPase